MSPLDKITGSDLSRGDVERPPELPNSDEQFLAHEEVQRGVFGWASEWLRGSRLGTFYRSRGG